MSLDNAKSEKQAKQTASEPEQSWSVPLFDVDFGEAEQKAVLDVVDSGWLTMGARTAEFERQFAEYVGVKHAIAVSSCTAALHLATQALGIGKGDEVLCPSLTFVAGPNSIAYTGARPVFTDVTSLQKLLIDPADIERKITPKTRAIQVVHFAGFACDMDAIWSIADKHGLDVIEDCAHAHGATYNHSTARCGSKSRIGCFSFFSNKNITTGEGGMLTTNDDELAQRLKSIRSHGMTTSTLDRHKGRANSYDVLELGFNYRIDEIRSSLGMVQLKKLDGYNQKRRELTAHYYKALESVDDVIVPFREQTSTSSCHILPIILPQGTDRASLMSRLRERGIQTSIHYPAAHQFGYYQERSDLAADGLSVTEDAVARELTLPLFPGLAKEDVDKICDILSEVLKA